MRETHIGLVFLVGDKAYKLKKPVNFGFLDFSTEPARQRACQDEVRLNRRLAPDVYLGVADITGPDGRVCDHLVVMRRMPDDRRLSTLIQAGHPLTATVRAIARIVAAFHSTAARDERISQQGSVTALRARWHDSFEQVRPFHGPLDATVAEEIERRATQFLDGRADLFADRIRTGKVVDGHGDLLADDIFCLDDGPRILDCLEFDDRLRAVDGLDDIAFLAMDLERRGAPRLAEQLLDDYVEFTGDPAPPPLRHHYLAYRAFVRAKVACLRYAQGDQDALDHANRDARLALRHLREGTVRLILVGGLPASGKTTLSNALAGHLGATVLSSDRIRKELADINPEQHATAGYREGIYRPEHTDRTYTELLRRAKRLLALGETVVLDASWTSAGQRRVATELAARTHSSLHPLRCWIPETVATRRLASRHDSMSDASPDVAAKMAADAALWPEADTVLTAGKLTDALTQALACLGLPQEDEVAPPGGQG